LGNLLHHIRTVKKAGINPVVAINAFHSDTEAEIKLVRKMASATIRRSRACFRSGRKTSGDSPTFSRRENGAVPFRNLELCPPQYVVLFSCVCPPESGTFAHRALLPGEDTSQFLLLQIV
jgi:hypothetical protein